MTRDINGVVDTMKASQPESNPEQESQRMVEPFPEHGRVLGIDYGTKRVGIAVSDVLQQLASPLHNYQRVSRQEDQRYFRNVAAEYEAVLIVVGLPLHMSGDESQKSREVRSWTGWLKGITGLPIRFQDERFTTAQAELLLQSGDFTRKQRQARVDKLAAQLLLQAWLDDRHRKETGLDVGL